MMFTVTDVTIHVQDRAVRDAVDAGEFAPRVVPDARERAGGPVSVIVHNNVRRVLRLVRRGARQVVEPPVPFLVLYFNNGRIG